MTSTPAPVKMDAAIHTLELNSADQIQKLKAHFNTWFDVIDRRLKLLEDKIAQLENWKNWSMNSDDDE